MRLHYISVHSVLEFDELKLFTEMGISVSSNGAYRDPRGSYTLPRPGIPGMKYSEEWMNLTAVHPKTRLPMEMIKPFDILLIMHSPEVLFQNWSRIKHKTVIWRSIGQSVPSTEAKLRPLFKEGLKIVRYSPKERNIDHYAGDDAIIRFYKDPDEFKDWNGDKKRVINITQSLKGRRAFCHYNEIIAATERFDRSVYGTGNEDLGDLNGGELTYELLKKELRDNRVYVYGGTWPAPYTLGFIEAMMTGIPIVAIGKGLAQIPSFGQFSFYEVPEIIRNGLSGYCSNSVSEMQRCIERLINDKRLAQGISGRARKRAIELFGKQAIRGQWEKFFASL